MSLKKTQHALSKSLQLIELPLRQLSRQEPLRRQWQLQIARWAWMGSSTARMELSVHLVDIFEEIGLTGSSLDDLQLPGCSSDEIRQILNDPHLLEITSASGSVSRQC